MVQAKIAAVAVVALLACAVSGAQEVVFTNGSRLAGTVEKYEHGFAYIRLIKEGGKTVLTTMPESAVDKEATELAQATASEPAQTREATTSDPFKLPHNDSSQRQPGIASVAAVEKDRRADVQDSGAATGRVFENGQRAAGIPPSRQIEAFADLREAPKAVPEMDPSARVAGLRFYEARLETLSSVFSLLGDEWNDMWNYCTPVTYQGGAQTPTRAQTTTKSFRPYASYREAVMNSFRRADETHGLDDKWSISCVRRNSDLVARGKQVVEVYDVVFEAYDGFATATDQSSRAVTRALPPNPL